MMRNTKQFPCMSSTTHALNNSHNIDFNNAKIIDKKRNRIKKTLESWHTAATGQADNNSKPLPQQYTILLRK